jgi:hypothetical protein
MRILYEIDGKTEVAETSRITMKRISAFESSKLAVMVEFGEERHKERLLCRDKLLTEQCDYVMGEVLKTGKLNLKGFAVTALGDMCGAK